MNIVDLYQDFSIPIAGKGDRHFSNGWVNTHCPFCEGSQDFHLGYSVQSNFFTCYRCGFHPIVETISQLTGLQWKEAREVIKQYGGDSDFTLIPEKSPRVRLKPHKLPSHTVPLQENHRKYLEKRNFDPDEIIDLWNVVGTGPVSILDDLNFKHRIIIPILWEGRQVSFTGRDITKKNDTIKYLTCPKEREYIDHKTILYGRSEKWGETGIAVEGPTDVWRLGFRAFATFGVKFTPAQVRLMAKTFKRVPVVFDGGEADARRQADRLVAELRFRGVDSFRVDITGDPGGMSQKEADYLVKQLIH